MENKDFSSPTTLQSVLFSRNGQIVHVDAFAKLNYNKDFLKFPETYFNTDEKISTFPLVSFDNKAELKEAKKLLTKQSNAFNQKSGKLAQRTIGELAQIASRDFRHNDTSELFSAVWALHSFHPFPKSVVCLGEKIASIKDRYPLLAEKAEELYLKLKDEAEFLVALEEHILSEKARLDKTIDIQALLLKMAKQNEEKRNALIEYANSLKGWRENVIENGELIVNGVNVGKEALCGIRIGQGIRIHPMIIFVFHDEKENKDYIAVKNYTQWRNSVLVVFDVIEKIPANVISERG